MNNQKKHNRKHSLMFKVGAVKRSHQGETAKQICDDLKIHQSLFYAWKKKFKRMKMSPDTKAKVTTDLRMLTDTQLTQLRHETPHDKAKDEALSYLRKIHDLVVSQISQDPQKIEDPVYLLALMARWALEDHRS